MWCTTCLQGTCWTKPGPHHWIQLHEMPTLTQRLRKKPGPSRSTRRAAAFAVPGISHCSLRRAGQKGCRKFAKPLGALLVHDLAATVCMAIIHLALVHNLLAVTMSTRRQEESGEQLGMWIRNQEKK